MVTLTRELERGLVEAGVAPEQAERIAVGVDERLSEVASRRDLADLRTEMRDMREQLQREMDKLERTMRRVFLGMGTIMLTMFGAVFGALMYAVFG